MEIWQEKVSFLVRALHRLHESGGDAFSLEYQAVLCAMREVELARCAWRDDLSAQRYGLNRTEYTSVSTLSTALTQEINNLLVTQEERLLVTPQMAFARYLAQTGRISG